MTVRLLKDRAYWMKQKAPPEWMLRWSWALKWTFAKRNDAKRSPAREPKKTA